MHRLPPAPPALNLLRADHLPAYLPSSTPAHLPARSSLFEHSNQYPPLMGLPQLRQAVAAHSGRHAGIPVDWQTETLVTLGATEALASAFLGLLNAGDEVVMFEPLYDSYVPMARRAGGVPRCAAVAGPAAAMLLPCKLHALGCFVCLLLAAASCPPDPPCVRVSRGLAD